MELREGLNSVLQWSRINVSIGRDQAGHDLRAAHRSGARHGMAPVLRRGR